MLKLHEILLPRSLAIRITNVRGLIWAPYAQASFGLLTPFILAGELDKALTCILAIAIASKALTCTLAVPIVSNLNNKLLEIEI